MLRVLVTALCFVVYCVGSFLNATCLIAVEKYTEWKKKPGLILIMNLCVSDLFHSVPFAWGCLEGLIGSHVHPWSPRIVGVLNKLSFLCCSVSIILMAINRFIGVLFTDWLEIFFTARKTFVYLVGVWVFCLAFLLAHLRWCCIVVFVKDLALSLYDLQPNRTNYMHDADLLLVYPALAITNGCYIAITIYLVYHKMSDMGSSSTLDLRLCLQFFLVIAAYSAFQAGWYFVPDRTADDPRLWFIISVVQAVNFTINPCVYLALNKTVKRSWLKLFGLGKSNKVSVINSKTTANNMKKN